MNTRSRSRAILTGSFSILMVAGLALAGPDNSKKNSSGTPLGTPPASKSPAAPATPPAATPAETTTPDGKTITLKVGDKAPALSIDKWVKGEQVTGFEKGKVYVVEFWATWCDYCKETIPTLTSLRKEHKDLTVIGVAGSERKTEGGADTRLSGLEKFVKAQGDKMGYSVAYDGERRMVKDWMDAAGRTGLPSAFIVNGEGKIAWIGDPRAMDDAIKAVMSHGKKDEKKAAAKDKAKQKKKK